MALPKAPVPRQAPRPRSVAPEVYELRDQLVAAGMENLGLKEVAEPVAQPPVTKPPRLTVNGIACKRLQIDFGSNATAFTPTGSVMERFWDQRDNGPDDDKYSRPRQFANDTVEVDISRGFLDLRVMCSDGSITRLISPTAHLNYSPA